MKINCTRIISILLVLVMLFSLSLTSCHLFNKDQGNQGDEGNNGGESGGDQIIPEDEYTLDIHIVAKISYTDFGSEAEIKEFEGSLAESADENSQISS